MNLSTPAIDVLVELEQKTQIPVINNQAAMAFVEKNCQLSFLNKGLRTDKSPTKNFSFIQQPLQNYYLYHMPSASISPFELIYLVAKRWSAKIGVSLSTDVHTPNTTGLIIYQLDETQWSKIPPDVKSEMLEEIEDGLSRNAVSILVLNNFQEASPLVRGFAQSMCRNPNVAVYACGELPPFSEFINGEIANSDIHLDPLTRTGKFASYIIDSTVV